MLPRFKGIYCSRIEDSIASLSQYMHHILYHLLVKRLR
jgi:hypothetical protein